MSRKRRVMLFFIILVFFNMAANFVHAVTPTVFSNLGLGNYMFGVALAAMQSINFLFSPFWGRLNDFISSRYSLLIGSLGYALGQLFFGIAQTEGQVIAARMFAGLFTAGAFVSILTYIVNTARDDSQRGAHLAVAAIINTIGGAFGYLVGGLLGEISISLAFGAQIVMLSLSGLAFFFICEKDVKSLAENIKILDIVKESNPFSAFLTSRRFMTVMLFVLFIVCILQSLGITAFDQTFNYYIKDQYNMSSGYNGVIKGMMGIITLIVNGTVTIRLMNKTNIKKSIIGVFAVSSAMMAMTCIVDTPVLFIASNVLYYAFAAISMPLLQSILAKSAMGDNSNLIMGFYNSMKSLGSIIGALLAGFLYAFAPKMPFVFGLISYVMACILSIVYYISTKANDAKLKLV